MLIRFIYLRWLVAVFRISQKKVVVISCNIATAEDFDILAVVHVQAVVHVHSLE